MCRTTSRRPCSPLSALQRELQQHINAGVAAAALAHWQAGEPDLAEQPDLASMQTWLRAADYESRDRVLLALLRQAVPGAPHGAIAAHVLVVWMTPAVVGIVRRLLVRLAAASQGTELSADQVQSDVIGHLWEQVRCYPLHRRSHVAANLLRDTETAMQRSYGVHCRQRRVITTESLPAPQVQRNASDELLELLALAVEQQWLDEAGTTVLAQRYFGEHPGRNGVTTDRHVAQMLGLSQPTITRLRNRAEQRLAASVRDHVLGLAS